jgi:hypothetical protein
VERSEVVRGRAAFVGVEAVLTFLLGVYFVYPVRQVVLVSLLTLLFAVVLGAPVDYLWPAGGWAARGAFWRCSWASWWPCN